MATTAQENSLQLGDTAPNFTAQTTEGDINFHDFIGNSWCVFFSHPKDFTPVCTTELGCAAKCKSQFEARNTKVIALSVDDVRSHNDWIADIDETQDTRVNFPIISDENRKIASLYGMIHPNADDTFTVRSVFIIDPSKKIRLMMTYPASTGRNFDEIFRVIDSMQLTDSHSVATPVNWHEGDDCVILPSITDPIELQKKFPKGWDEKKPYLRMTPQPNKQ
ncbi:MAG: peroxiredoxin [Chlamydiota bacterium]|nr:peroxiredoxin [Chlamydiota bacterium]